VTTVDDYLGGLDEDSRAAFERVRAVATEVVPEVGQGRSYGMAVLTYRGKPLLGFAAAAQHLSVFPFSPAAVDRARDRVPAARVSKGTLRFTADAPLPDDVVRDVVAWRRDEIEGSAR
jgi:uncharacterized protein YdhG (YjbR/CyaY superfamily)